MPHKEETGTQKAMNDYIKKIEKNPKKIIISYVLFFALNWRIGNNMLSDFFLYMMKVLKQDTTPFLLMETMYNTPYLPIISFLAS